MFSIRPDTTIKEYQDFVREVYGLPNDRFFSSWDMLTSTERFTMRGLKGIRKGDRDKTRLNLLISLSWLTSMMNQFHIDIENEVWKRFPYLCSYCASCPCVCKKEKVEIRQRVFIDGKKRPKTLEGFQEMFRKIYPPESRTLEHSGIHLAEELGEFGETLLAYRGGHKGADFNKIPPEAADLFSCFMGVFNSLGMNVAKELSIMFSNNCHICHKAPCACSFKYIAEFES
jgi:NTP pyrophosphatase (non-canonical NTP hydrolase)